MWRSIALVLGVGCFVVAGCSRPGDSDASGPVQFQPAAVPTVLILDASGSMTEADAPGPRIDAAKRAAQALVDARPDGVQMGLLTHGTGAGSSDAEQDAGCRDVRVVHNVGEANNTRSGNGLGDIRLGATASPDLLRHGRQLIWP